jgi:hypothetical protein
LSYRETGSCACRSRRERLHHQCLDRKQKWFNTEPKGRVHVVGQWESFAAARLAMLPNFRQEHAAARYR